jgi:hypothetical protein
MSNVRYIEVRLSEAEARAVLRALDSTPKDYLHHKQVSAARRASEKVEMTLRGGTE